MKRPPLLLTLVVLCLAFIQRNRRLEVIGANTSAYHGARAYFDGRYVRTGDLDAAGRSKVMKAAKEGAVPEQ